MRVCPKCGYIDDLIWRHSLKYGIDWAPYSEFTQINPEIAQKLLKEKFVEEGYYVYHLTKGMNVERQAIFENPTYKQRWAIPIEAGRKGAKMTVVSKIMSRIKIERKNQTRLFEVTKNE